METKRILGGVALVAALVLSSCGGGGSMGSKSALFGDIPDIYEKRQTDFAEQFMKIKDSEDADKFAELFKNYEASLQEAEKEAQPLADKMVGKSVAYVVGDSLPYQVVSDILVEKVYLPEVGLSLSGNKQTRLRVKFDVVVTGEVDRGVYLYYWLMDNDTPMDYGRTSAGKCALGDTVRVDMVVSAPDVPASYQEKCNALKFITKVAYDEAKKGIDERQKQWNEEMKKKLGVTEE